MPGIPRRKFSLRLGSLCLFSTLRPFAAAQSVSKTRLILLGTAGALGREKRVCPAHR
jgi:hypothetical protein